MNKRVRFNIRKPKGAKYWRSTARGREPIQRRTQREAIAATAAICRALWRAGTPCELMIHGLDGRVRDNRTYGNDPKGNG